MRPRLLDLFCGAGGAAVGYYRAGFDVVGVDIAPQPRYPFESHQGDALHYLAERWQEFDAIHASPPCQRFSAMSACRPGLADDYPDLVAATRGLADLTGLPYVLENVPGSPLRPDLTLCGHMFGLKLYRHRVFETNVLLRQPEHPEHITPGSKAGHWQPGQIISISGHCSPIALAREAMGIDWMNRAELAESIPPAFTEWIGRQLISSLAIDASTLLGSSRARTHDNDASPGRKTDSLPSTGGRSGSESFERLRQGASAESASCSLALSRGRDAQG